MTSSPLPRIEARLLGRPSVLLDGAPPNDPKGHWRLAPTRELFYLLEANRPGLSPEQIVDRLWPDAPPGRGQQLFWHYSHRLRAILGGGAVTKEQALWRLNPEVSVVSDVSSFESAAESLREALSGSPEEAAALDQAQELYGGPYLDGVYSLWASSRRRALERAWHEVLRRLALRHIREGEHASAIRVSQQLLKSEPLSEESARLLIQALRSAGLGANARQVYHRFARRVEREFGAAPASSLRAFLAGT